jgi:hypothetical protein
LPENKENQSSVLVALPDIGVLLLQPAPSVQGFAIVISSPLSRISSALESLYLE